MDFITQKINEHKSLSHEYPISNFVFESIGYEYSYNKDYFELNKDRILSEQSDKNGFWIDKMKIGKNSTKIVVKINNMVGELEITLPYTFIDNFRAKILNQLTKHKKNYEFCDNVDVWGVDASIIEPIKRKKDIWSFEFN